ncbi:MAG TPA: CYTH and CHAD domain-containing protein [Gaiellaceae bacterium]|nr:CYTH and CHAD domain-containing protein [Gaiellaceae bacterium]
MEMALERELKLDADAAFELPPDLGEPLESRLFTSTYYDTPIRSLLRSGITLRRRVERGLSHWQLKLPRDDGREELEAAGGPAGPPDDLRRLLTAHLRHGALGPVATLRTRRAGYRVADHGRPVADVTLDAVDVLEGQRQAGAFRELEVELVDGGDHDLDRLGKILRRAGARRSDGRSKLMRVLPLEDGPADPYGLRAQLQQLERHDPGVRLGDDAEDLHRFRVATRRTRAIVRATRPLLGDLLTPLSGDLAWLAGVLGPVRDLDVLIDRLRVEVAALDADASAGDELVATLEEQRARHRDVLLEALDSQRYVELLARFERDIEGVEAGGDVVALAAKAFKRLRRDARALGKDPDDESVHVLRKTAKKARYAAELVDDRKVARYVAALKELQDVVGVHQDAVVAEGQLREIARARTAVAAGRLIASERARRRDAREALKPALDAALARGEKAF